MMVLLTLLCLFYLVTASLLIHGARKVISLTLRNFNCRLHNDNGSIVLLTLTKTLHQGKAGLLVPWMVVTFLSLVYDLVAGLIKMTDTTVKNIITIIIRRFFQSGPNNRHCGSSRGTWSCFWGHRFRRRLLSLCCRLVVQVCILAI